MQIKQTRDLTSPYYQDGLAIRQAVFVAEQKVPAEMEIDEFEDQALYFTGYLDQTTCCHITRIDRGRLLSRATRRYNESLPAPRAWIRANASS